VQCHDVDGRGEIVRDTLPRIPDFTEPQWQAGRTEDQLSRSILDGKGKSMPRMKDKLGSVDVRQMVALVRGFRGGGQVVEGEPEEPLAPERPAAVVNSTGFIPRPAEPSPPSMAERSIREGSRLFQRSCAMCHGADGRGSGVRATMPAIPDFTARAWQERRTDPQLIVSILEGKGTNMPAFRDKVAREQTRNLVAFLRRFAPGATPQPAAAAPGDFEARFRQLMEEFEGLRRQSSFGSPPAAQPKSQAAPPLRVTGSSPEARRP
jgi:mono/diheme cytochrome c family protein